MLWTTLSIVVLGAFGIGTIAWLSGKLGDTAAREREWKREARRRRRAEKRLVRRQRSRSELLGWLRSKSD